ncbi:MAG TPA: hypothetical protein VKY89_03300, partial [Thermoanaerobaculia bacterium]|nr:hypothetical protein [Thermoanaerobaculia bacterium]
MSLDPKAIFMKAATRAATSTGNVVSGAGALAAAAAIWNPLPLLLWGLGSAAWVLYASTSPKYTRRVLDAERLAAELAADQERQALRAKIEATLARRPFAGWLRAGVLPDYLQAFGRLVAVRDRVAQTLAERRDDFLASLGIQKQLTYLLGAYLQFVQARLTVLQLLADFRPAGSGADAGGGSGFAGGQGGGEELAAAMAAMRDGAAPSAAGEQTGAATAPLAPHWVTAPGAAPSPRRGRSPMAPISEWVPAAGSAAAATHGRSAVAAVVARGQAGTGAGGAGAGTGTVAGGAAAELPEVAALVADLDRRIATLNELKAREPATAKTREWHISILQKQQELLRDCASRDQQLVAQLTAVP